MLNLIEWGATCRCHVGDMLAWRTHVCHFDPRFDTPTSDIPPTWHQHVSKWHVSPTLAVPLPTAFCVLSLACRLTCRWHVGPTNTCQLFWPPFQHANIRQSQQSELPRARKPSTLKGCVQIVPDGYVRTNPLPQVPTKQCVPTSRIRLPPYFGLPIVTPTLFRIVGPAIARARIPWWFYSSNLTTLLCY